MSVKQLIEDVTQICNRNNIKLTLSETDKIDYGDGSMVNGYFLGSAPDSEQQSEFAVAIGKPEIDWLPVFIHESCHMDQFLEDSEVWLNQTLDNEMDGTAVLFEWIGGKEFDRELIEACAFNTFLLELDCERRSVEKMKKYNLPIDIRDYTMKSTCYALFYKYLLQKRAWYKPGIVPYEIKEVYSAFPDTFDIDIHAPLTEAQIQAFEKCF
jgi:hypothetical protein